MYVGIAPSSSDPVTDRLSGLSPYTPHRRPSSSAAPVQKVCPHCRTEYGPEVDSCPVDGARLVPRDPVDPRIGQLLTDRYRVIKAIGEGGMGRVYLAEHTR
ncbi:MAG: serine/threonine protein kinase, partial [Gemmatimonadetes bacterium]|nr:serine/threonine protein kinase [Gemmatimonadota bacterium]